MYQRVRTTQRAHRKCPCPRSRTQYHDFCPWGTLSRTWQALHPPTLALRFPSTLGAGGKEQFLQDWFAQFPGVSRHIRPQFTASLPSSIPGAGRSGQLPGSLGPLTGGSCCAECSLGCSETGATERQLFSKWPFTSHPCRIDNGPPGVTRAPGPSLWLCALWPTLEAGTVAHKASFKSQHRCARGI